MLGFVFYILSALCKRSIILNPAISLFGPPVDDNGRSLRYDFKGEYAVTAYSSKGISYTQLGYDALKSSAMLVSRVPTDSSNYRIDYKIRLHRSERPGKMGGGMAFFITKDPSIQEGPAFGVSGEFDGGLVVMDLNGDNGKPFVGGVVGEGIKYNAKDKGRDILTQAFISESLLSNEFTFRLEQESGFLKVSMGRLGNEVVLLKLKSDMGKGYHVGISALQRNGSPLFRLYGIRFYKIVPPVKHFEKADVPKKRTRKAVWALVVLVSCVIGYYLLGNYRKYK